MKINKPTFNELSDRYLKEQAFKKSIDTDQVNIEILRPHIGNLTFDKIYRGYDERENPTALEKFIIRRSKEGLSLRTINASIETINKIGNQALRKWRTSEGKPVLQTFFPSYVVSKAEASALGFRLPSQNVSMSWDHQIILFNQMNDRLREVCLFAVNTGLREKEIVRLRWEWEQFDKESGIRFFMIPAEHYKNGENRLVVLNSVAEQIVKRWRGLHSRYVFSYKGERFDKINSTSFKQARIRGAKVDCEIRNITVHSFRVTFSTRLRAAKVPEEDRKDLMGHSSGRSMTTFYSLPGLELLKEYVERVTKPGTRTITLKRRNVKC